MKEVDILLAHVKSWIPYESFKKVNCGYPKKRLVRSNKK